MAEASGRIRSLISSTPMPAGELDARQALGNPGIQPYVDIQAYQRLLSGGHDRIFNHQLLPSLLDEAVSARPPEYVSLLNSIKPLLEADRVSHRYAYIVRVSEENRLRLYYATSMGYFDRFHELCEHYRALIRSLDDALWDTIQYINYRVLEARDEEVKKKIYSYYSRIPPRYLKVIVLDSEAIIYAPIQLIGRIVGRKGATIKQLEQAIGRRVRVRRDEQLTELYAGEHPEMPSDPELVKMISQAIAILDELEKKGVTAEQVLRIRQSMRAPEDESHLWEDALP